MKKIKFALLWLPLPTFLFVCMLLDGDYRLSLGIFPFIAVGIVIFCLGVKEIHDDKKSKLKGEISYGIIIQIGQESKDYYNGKMTVTSPNCTAIVRLYIESLNQTKDINEIIKKPEDYKYGDCLKVKYYNDDIYILEKVDYNNIPIVFQNNLKDAYEKYILGNWNYSDSENNNNIKI